jgi:hypothetical protein
VVHEHVRRPQGRPHVVRAVEGAHGVRRPRLVFQARHVHRRVELEEVGESREAFAFVEIVRLQFELVQQRGEDVGRQVDVVLQPHRRAQAPAAQALLYGGEQVVAIVAGLQVGVARDTDGVTREHVVAAVDLGQVQADHVLEQHEDVPAGGVRQRDEAWQHGAGDVQHRQRAVRQRGGCRGPDGGHDAERAVAQVRKGMAAVDRERREDGHERVAEVVVEEAALLVADVLGAQEQNALVGEQGQDVLEETAVLLLHERVHVRGHGRHRLRAREPVRPRRRLVPRVDVPLEGGHAHHEELVEVRAEDGEELHPLQQRHGGIPRLVEDAPVELQPRQLPVDEILCAHALPRSPNVSRSNNPSRTPCVHTTRVR